MKINENEINENEMNENEMNENEKIYLTDLSVCGDVSRDRGRNLK